MVSGAPISNEQMPEPLHSNVTWDHLELNRVPRCHESFSSWTFSNCADFGGEPTDLNPSFRSNGINQLRPYLSITSPSNVLNVTLHHIWTLRFRSAGHIFSQSSNFFFFYNWRRAGITLLSHATKMDAGGCHVPLVYKKSNLFQTSLRYFTRWSGYEDILTFINKKQIAAQISIFPWYIKSQSRTQHVRGIHRSKIPKEAPRNKKEKEKQVCQIPRPKKTPPKLKEPQIISLLEREGGREKESAFLEREIRRGSVREWATAAGHLLHWTRPAEEDGRRKVAPLS